MHGTASNKRLAPPRPTAAQEKRDAPVSERSEISVVSKVHELLGSRPAGFAGRDTLCAMPLY